MIEEMGDLPPVEYDKYGLPTFDWIQEKMDRDLALTPVEALLWEHDLQNEVLNAKWRWLVADLIKYIKNGGNY